MLGRSGYPSFQRFGIDLRFFSPPFPSVAVDFVSSVYEHATFLFLILCPNVR